MQTNSPKHALQLSMFINMVDKDKAGWPKIDMMLSLLVSWICVNLARSVHLVLKQNVHDV